ncbi:antibiotic biosynthesis monooxygenase [Streptomyces sp. NBC_00377]|uniref:antibiotic biosynthesis monooxygenase family protein n=1 Tax=unclassified Streptomyces TaxID=2593676 RepID=UPI002E1AAD9B|nr:MULTISPECIES: antibiotic biosynthesis monooxygenase [unclassified Streptomyces]
MTAAPVEVVLHHLSDDAPQVERAYHEASRRMAGTPGLLGNRLLHSVGDPRALVVVSRWSDWEAFESWERGEAHKEQTAPLRPFRDLERDRPFEIYREVAHYEGGHPVPAAEGARG